MAGESSRDETAREPAAEPGFLAGLRVLDLSRLLPGPFLTMVLSDMGADVIKIEDPRLGDYLRSFPPHKAGVGGRFLAINRNKRSVALDLKTEPGREALLSMVASADVVVESFRPGVLDRLGVGYDVLSERNPTIVVCSISGYGQTGPYRDRAGHDINYISLAGVLGMGGAAEGAPVLPGVQVADLAGGALWGATGVLGALIGRERTGKGAHLDISMCEGALALLATELGNLSCGGEPPRRGTGMLNGGVACYGVYRAGDGRYLSVGALEPKFWKAFNEAIGRAVDARELLAGPEEQARVRGEIESILSEKTRDEWVAFFADGANGDCLCEPILDVDELQDHPLHRDRGVFFDLETRDGPVAQVRTPIGAPARRDSAPTLGQHTRQVLEEFGVDPALITAVAGE